MTKGTELQNNENVSIVLDLTVIHFNTIKFFLIDSIYVFASLKELKNLCNDGNTLPCKAVTEASRATV